MLAVIKAVMMVEHKTLLPNAGFEEFNKGISERRKLRVTWQTLILPLRGLGADIITGAPNSYSDLYHIPTTHLRDEFW